MNAVQQGRSLKKLMGSLATILGGMGAMQVADAAIWSDTSIGWRYGTQFAEPYKNDAAGDRIDITKQIFNLTHASGDKYGSNFLMSIYFSQMMSPTVPSQVVKVPKKPMW
ncbi:hypothetical protein OK024_14270 [Acinetobacter sp. UGAL515B_02]|nr:hypothetical protein [Acinetobacter sp. UGAL515B_02]WON79933.1 hypothetical protein OK024_14270 [Acinetobacter sp. UGAL515B_02]